MHSLLCQDILFHTVDIINYECDFERIATNSYKFYYENQSQMFVGSLTGARLQGIGERCVCRALSAGGDPLSILSYRFVCVGE